MKRHLLPDKVKEGIGLNQKFKPGTLVMVKKSTDPRFSEFPHGIGFIIRSQSQYYGAFNPPGEEYYSVYFISTKTTHLWFPEKNITEIK